MRRKINAPIVSEPRCRPRPFLAFYPRNRLSFASIYWLHDNVVPLVASPLTPAERRTRPARVRQHRCIRAPRRIQILSRIASDGLRLAAAGRDSPELPVL